MASSFEAISTLIRSNLKLTIFQSNQLRFILFSTLHCSTGSSSSGQSVGNAVMLARAQLIVIFSVPKMAYPNQGRNCLKVLKSIDDLCLLVMVGLF